MAFSLYLFMKGSHFFLKYMYKLTLSRGWPLISREYLFHAWIAEFNNRQTGEKTSYAVKAPQTG